MMQHTKKINGEPREFFTATLPTSLSNYKGAVFSSKKLTAQCERAEKIQKQLFFT